MNPCPCGTCGGDPIKECTCSISMVKSYRNLISGLLLEAVEPQVVIISVGEENRFGHPSPEVIERYGAYGLSVLRTDERGTIEFITDGKRLWVETAR